jgi:RecB family endonuclease NucS
VTEEMFAANACDIFHTLYDYDFTKANRDVKFKENGKDLVEVDIFLENGDTVMAIEVKPNLTKDHIDEHIKRIEKIRYYMDLPKHNDQRKLVGAVAGGNVPENVRDYAEEKGLYVLVQNGENVKVEESKEYKPKRW